MTSSDWRAVRALRADPPAGAGRDDRRRFVFQSALTQAEELSEAASIVGPASSPLPLFYSLSQAGRAICAAWIPKGPWQPKSHGLTGTEPPRGDPLSLRVSVTDDALGAYSMVASATASATFSGSVSLAELWATLPEFPTPSDVVGEAKKIILIERTTAASNEPDPFMRALDQSRGRLILSVERQELEEELAAYPTTRGFEVEEVEDTMLGMTHLVLRFPDEAGHHRSLWEIGDSLPSEDRARRRFAIRPQIGQGPDPPPSQLLTLWALLFGLSRLARYHPDHWVRALNPDRSPIAVHLEHGLEVALRRLPSLVVAAASGRPIIERAILEDLAAKRSEGSPSLLVEAEEHSESDSAG
jgi:hypothetical protein